MRILWASNAPWAPTGYGVQTALTVQRMKAAGHEVAVGSNFGLQGAAIDWEGIPVLPSGTDAYSNDILPAQHHAWMNGAKGWLITLYDVWVFKDSYFRDINIASWTPVDHYPVPPGVLAWAKMHETIAMSRYGHQALADKGIQSTYIPHAVDRAIFRPLDRVECRKALAIPDDVFAVFINAANKGAHPPRKAWSENFGALSVFMAKRPDVHLYVHSDIFGVNGVDLAALAGRWALDAARVHFVDQLAYKLGKFTGQELAAMYSASDVLLATSMGEGFGVPTIEAQACGIPIIVSKFAASPELLGAGWLVDGQPEDDPLQGAYFYKPFIASIVDALEQAYEVRGSETIRQQAIDKAAEYDADAVFTSHWLPYLARLEDMLKPKLSRRGAPPEEGRVISVITASIPSRTAMLAECMASVAAQSLQPLEHLVVVDHARWGSAATRNAALAGARGEWIAVVDDDDILWTEHLAKLSALTDKADIVYSFCDVIGKAWNPNSDFDAERLRSGNYIPATSLIRTKLLRKLHGWRDAADSPGGLEDWDLWLRALDAKARFVCLPEVT